MIGGLQLAQFRFHQFEARYPWLPWLLPLFVCATYMGLRTVVEAYSTGTTDALVQAIGCTRAPLVGLCVTDQTVNGQIPSESLPRARWSCCHCIGV